VAKAINLVLSDENIDAILINIFAGINLCDWVAEGIVQAMNKFEMKVPVVVRLSGTNVEERRKIIAESGVSLIIAESLDEAASKSVAAAAEGGVS
jgi:malate-CoA ligase subunit beta